MYNNWVAGENGGSFYSDYYTMQLYNLTEEEKKNCKKKKLFKMLFYSCFFYRV